MHGQRLRPESYNPLVDLISEPEIQGYLVEVEGLISKCVNVMQTHATFIHGYCAADKVG